MNLGSGYTPITLEVSKLVPEIVQAVIESNPITTTASPSLLRSFARCWHRSGGAKQSNGESQKAMLAEPCAWPSQTYAAAR